MVNDIFPSCSEMPIYLKDIVFLSFVIRDYTGVL